MTSSPEVESDVESEVATTSAALGLTLSVIHHVPTTLLNTRRRLGLTQRDVADAAGLSQALLVRVEQGALNLRVDTLRRLLLWLSVAVTVPTPVYVPRRRLPPRG